MEKCVYDYQNSCTCAEDDKCGCDYDNNMDHDVSCFLEHKKTLKAKTKNLRRLFDNDLQNNLKSEL